MAKKRKVFEIDAENIMLKKLSDFKEELYERVPADIYDLIKQDTINSLIELCYKAGFQDGAIDIGEMIQDIIKGEIEGPEVNPN
jgi:hypothetical protein